MRGRLPSDPVALSWEVPDMSIPGMSPAGILLEGVGDGEVPDMSIPGMSADIEEAGVLIANVTALPLVSLGVKAATVCGAA